MAERPSSNTMEINSILEEARSRNQSISEKPSSASARTSAPRSATVNRTMADNEDYVDISNGGAYSRDEQQAKPKKSKKPVIITVVVVLVLALAGAGGFIWFKYQHSGSSNIVADNITVNGVDIGGKTMDEAKKAMADIEQSLADGIKVHVKAADKDYNLTKDDFTYTFNTENILSQIKEHSEEKSLNKEAKSYEITMKVDTSKTQAIVDKIAGEVHAAPANAKVTKFDSSASDMFTFQKEVVGRDIDSADLVNKINGIFQGGKNAGEAEAKVNSVEPKYTEDYLKSHIVKLSEYSTESTNNSNGNENMRVSLAACNDSIIEPGESWSFNDCTGDSNQESNGYMPAGVIVEGRSETGIGGGICQSSTTIYNATLLCGMEVVERACHYYPSTYVDAGRDATIDYGNIDLVMKNPFKYQLFMKCWMDGTQLNCEIYGLENSGFDEIKISTSDPDFFSNGYTVKAWRTFYKDGKEVNEEELPSSTYYNSAPSSDSDSDSDSGSSSDDDDDDDDDSSDSSSSSDDSSGNSDSGSSSEAADSGDSGAAADSGNSADSGADSGGGEAADTSGE